MLLAVVVVLVEVLLPLGTLVPVELVVGARVTGTFVEGALLCGSLAPLPGEIMPNARLKSWLNAWVTTITAVADTMSISRAMERTDIFCFMVAIWRWGYLTGDFQEVPPHASTV